MPEQEPKVSYLKAFENPIVIEIEPGREVFTSLKRAVILNRKLTAAISEAMGGE